MHAVFFGVKRVHIEVVRLTQKMILHSNLTPARFDLLRIVRLYPDGIGQGSIQWLLGVTAPVVSRMLKALETLGYVERERPERDRRTQWIRLTHRGAIAVGVASSATLGDLEAERTAARAVTGNTRLVPETYEEILTTIKEAKDTVARVDGFLDAMRKALADRAAFNHPWLPICDRLPPMIFTTMVDGRLRYGDEDLLAMLG
jgi:DNA-binding MarR family transcriptional regulator